MRINEIYRPGQFGLSFEIFPPKTSDADQALEQTLRQLARYRPAFISCTYGAAGSTRDRTLDWCEHIQQQLGLTATAHFTCVGLKRNELVDWLSLARQRGIGNIMALRGDAPEGAEKFPAVEGGLRYANELVALIRKHHPDLGVGVASYPEKHQEAPDAQIDLDNLKRKVDAGADAVFTQLFYVNRNFFDFRERYLAAGIDKPLIPGIMPITDFARIKRITSMCGTIFPHDLSSRLEAVQEDKQAQFEIGVEHAIEQCRELMEQGAPGIHFYVLNRSRACETILEALGFKPSENDIGERGA